MYIFTNIPSVTTITDIIQGNEILFISKLVLRTLYEIIVLNILLGKEFTLKLCTRKEADFE